MASWEFRWPTGVTANHLYERSRTGVRLSARARAWRDEVVVIVRQSGQQLPEGKLAFLLRFSPPNRLRRDADNLLKLAQDAVCAGLGIDDSRFVATVAFRREPSKTHPRIEVSCEPLPAELAMFLGRESEEKKG